MKKAFRYYYRLWFWNLSRIFSYVYLRPKFNLEVRNKEAKIPKRPFIMICNHGTFFDPWLIGHMSRYPISIMMNEEGFKSPKFVQWYLRNVGAFPKKKGESDIRAMKYTLKELKEGYPVLIFPEGQTTWDGQTQPIFGGIESIIKRSKLPLVLMRITGNFISKPWWSESFRKGKVIIHRKVVSADELSAMSKQEIREEVIEYISNSDLENDEMKQTKFVGMPATQGIERFMWMCKTCGKEDCISGDDKVVSCIDCGASWTLDTHFKLSVKSDNAVEVGTLLNWARWHKEKVKEKISTATDEDVLTSNSNVHHCDVTDIGEYPTISTGQLQLTKKYLTFTPDDSSKEKIELAVENINDYVFQMKTIFECRHKGNVYKFRFEDKSPMKWVYYFRYLNNYDEFEKRGYI